MNEPRHYHTKLSKSDKDKYMWKLKKKKDTNEFIYKTERDSQTYKTNLWSPKGKGELGDKLGGWD